MVRKFFIFSISICLGFLIFYNLKINQSDERVELLGVSAKEKENQSEYLPKLGNVLSFPDEEPEDESLTSQMNERKPGEWEGMLAPKFHPPCQTHVDCGLAMACIDGICGGCGRDDDCGEGEGCVLEHCVLETEIECSSRTECDNDSLCVLSSYSDGTRGNADMRSFCRSSYGGTEQVDDREEQELFEKARGPRPKNQLVNDVEQSKDLRYETP